MQFYIKVVKSFSFLNTVLVICLLDWFWFIGANEYLWELTSLLIYKWSRSACLHRSHECGLLYVSSTLRKNAVSVHLLFILSRSCLLFQPDRSPSAVLFFMFKPDKGVRSRKLVRHPARPQAFQLGSFKTSEHFWTAVQYNY